MRTADCEVRAADCHVRPRQCHVLASDSDVLVRNWRLPWFQWQVRKTEWQRRAGEKQARRSGCHVRRFECRVRQFQCRLRKRQRHVRRFRWHVRPIHGSTRGSLMPVVSMTAGFFTPSLIGYEPFFRARDALRITLRVSLEDKDDSRISGGSRNRRYETRGSSLSSPPWHSKLLLHTARYAGFRLAVNVPVTAPLAKSTVPLIASLLSAVPL